MAEREGFEPSVRMQNQLLAFYQRFTNKVTMAVTMKTALKLWTVTESDGVGFDTHIAENQPGFYLELTVF